MATAAAIAAPIHQAMIMIQAGAQAVGIQATQIGIQIGKKQFYPRWFYPPGLFL